jgi:hypothetical protein
MPRAASPARSSIRRRQVHLDFHTGPHVHDVAADFDARAFARTMRDACVDSVTLFAKCHHGHLYYNTADPARHPALRRKFDLLRKQVDALRAWGIRTPIYISVQCDEYAANLHPDWVATKPDTSMVKWGDSAFAAGWQILDMSSPYQEYVAGQTAEVLRLFKPVDGVFFDMCWDQPSCSRYAVAGMRELGLDPESEPDRAAYANRVTHAYMKRFRDMVLRASPAAGVYFNGRPYHALHDEIGYQSQVEIEALPTGGWGYTYFPKNVRFGRNFGKPCLGMTARFHKSWADFGGLKPYAALEYETAQMMAHGAGCSVGDQLPPRGTLDPAAYDLIGRVYRRVADREPWLDGATPVVQVGLFNLPAAFSTHGSVSGTDEGAVRMLTQLRHQFDVIARESDFGRYDLLILPDAVRVTPDLAEKLATYLESGGRLLATGTSGLSDDGTRLLLKQLPVRPEGFSPFTTTYVRFDEAISQGVPAADHVMYERGVRVRRAPGSAVLARVVEPYFERAWDHFSSHFQTPPSKLTDYPAAVQKRNVAYIPFPIFRAFAQHGNYPYRLLVGNLIDRLLPDPLVRADGPTGLEVTVTRQPHGSANRTVVHLLFYSPERRTPQLDIVEDVVPLFSVPLSVRLGARPNRAYLAPDGTEVPFRFSHGRAELTVPEIRGHAMIVLE